MDWHTNAIPLPRKFRLKWVQRKIFHLNGTDRPELHYYSYSGSSTLFYRLYYQKSIEKNQIFFPVTGLNVLYIGIFTYQPYDYDWSTGTANSKSLRKDDAECLGERDSWSPKSQETSIDYD